MTNMPKEIWVGENYEAWDNEPCKGYGAVKYTRAEPASAAKPMSAERKEALKREGQIPDIVFICDTLDACGLDGDHPVYDSIDRVEAALAQTPTATDAEAQKALDALERLKKYFGVHPSDSMKMLNDFETIRAALSRMAPQWQDISTAPSDQKILFYVANAYVQGHVRTGVIIDGVTYSYFDDGEDAGMMTEVFATHWMPLPAPPADRGGGDAEI